MRLAERGRTFFFTNLTMNTMTPEPAVKRSRGRKATVGRWYSLEEAAVLLGCGDEPERLRLALEACPEDFPGADCEDGVWSLPGRALKAFLLPLPFGDPPCTVAQAARYLCAPEPTVRGWLALEGPNGERVLRSEMKLGRRLIPVIDVLRAPPELPAWAKVCGRSSLFFGKRNRGGASR
ncbi:MAG: hypothetical protein JWO08_2351 [Verrucomicrobiaceae bacterium]|nr:hypothetical protein [Verrucomicrobiaceae bacterium]